MLFRIHFSPLAAVVLTSLAASAFASVNFLKSGLPHEADAQKSLLMELTANATEGAAAGRRKKIQDELSNMYVAMPKNSMGRLTHQAVRYALHRYFARQHGWFIRGLEPNNDTWHGEASAHNSSTMNEWVPSYLQDIVEQIPGQMGTDLYQLSAMAAALEDLIEKEAVGRVEAAYQMSQISKEESLGEEDAESLVRAYYVGFLNAGSLVANDFADLEVKMDEFERAYPGWPAAEEWMRDLFQVHLTSRKSEDYNFNDIVHVAQKVGEEYHSFNDRDCVDLKATLRKLQGRKPGRVRLSAFYNKSIYTHWGFYEKREYLRTLGALDESDASTPYVIIPNYAMARPNCLDSSNIYTICCRNECEELMSSLESSIGGATAAPEQIMALVSALPSASVPAPRSLSDSVLGRLDEVALRHGGQIPLHSRLFAQWMHHAYPLECPYPHEFGTVNPLSPNEWIKETGIKDIRISVEEMMEQVARDSCAVGANEGVDCAGETAEIPWNENEEEL